MKAVTPPDSKHSALLEVGCEELPATLLPVVINELKNLALSALLEKRLSCETVFSGGTPARLVLRLDGLSGYTQSSEMLVTGPPLAASGSWPGAPSSAVLGFARSQGVSPESLEVVTQPKGSYLAFRKVLPSQCAFDVLPDIFSGILSGLAFPKSMRWGAGTGPFLRPILWILALSGDEVAGFEFGGQVSGRLTFSPRFRGGGPVLLRNVAHYEREVRSWDVELDLTRRREKIQNDLYRALRIEEDSENWPEGLALHIDPGLLEEVAGLVEGYRVVPATLPEKYRTIPAAVIRTVLKVHQRFFVVDSPEGKPVAYFLGVSGNPQGDLATIREGYIRVVTARLEDAAYYIHRDLARTLEDRSGDLDSVAFFPGVGSLGDKVRTTKALVQDCLAFLPDATLSAGGFSRGLLSGILDQAVTVYKSDLLTGLVKEFPELEGIVGGIYLLQEFETRKRAGGASPDRVADVSRAIASHYEPRTFRDSVPSDLPSAILSLCDRAAGQAGAFLGGANPTGSIDPFALRRGASGMIRILIEHAWPIPLASIADQALTRWNRPDKEGVRKLLLEFWEDRLLSLLSRDGELLWGRAARLAGEPCVVSFRRAEFLRSFLDTPAFFALETVKTRVDRILPEGFAFTSPDPAKFRVPEEHSLWSRLKDLSAPPFPPLPEVRDFVAEVERILPVLPEIRSFFDAVLVNDPDQEVRSNRLALLSVLSARLSLFGSLDLLLSAAKKDRPAG